jgi:Rrf2 family iron-sulfur cluster assembly transcriptional regulator
MGKVLTELVKKKFIASTKGPMGGFRLSVDPTRVTLYRVLAALGGLSRLEDDCVMGLETCSDDVPCALHDEWQAFKKTAVYKAQQLPLSELSEIVLTKSIGPGKSSAKGQKP